MANDPEQSLDSANLVPVQRLRRRRSIFRKRRRNTLLVLLPRLWRLRWMVDAMNAAEKDAEIDRLRSTLDKFAPEIDRLQSALNKLALVVPAMRHVVACYKVDALPVALDIAVFEDALERLAGILIHQEHRCEWREMCEGLSAVGMERFHIAMGVYAGQRDAADLERGIAPWKVKEEREALALCIQKLSPVWKAMEAVVLAARKIEGIFEGKSTLLDAIVALDRAKSSLEDES